MTSIDKVVERLEQEHARQPNFLQATREVSVHVDGYIDQQDDEALVRAFEVLTRPDRVIEFRVDWEDDEGRMQSNRGYRVQFNNLLGPYKGGLRFTAGLDLDTLLFLGFEQTFKNALTGLPMGGAKGGADFDPRDRSEREIRRFCQSFMTQLSHHIGPDVDVPAGDIGVGAREIGYMFHQFKKIRNVHQGVLTGKDAAFGGSLIRTEATGYGCVYFTRAMLRQQDDSLEGKRCLISGAGNVALYTAARLLEEGALVCSLSDSEGVVRFEDGMDQETLQKITEARGNRVRLSEMEGIQDAYTQGETPWSDQADLCFPCATQNEIDEDAAKQIVDNGVTAVIEGANMPCTAEAHEKLKAGGVLIAPSKAVNAGGVAVSGLEISQNRMRMSWDAEQVDTRLQTIMERIHDTCLKHGGDGDIPDYQRGANIAAFEQLVRALRFSGLL